MSARRFGRLNADPDSKVATEGFVAGFPVLLGDRSGHSSSCYGIGWRDCTKNYGEHADLSAEDSTDPQLPTRLLDVTCRIPVKLPLCHTEERASLP
jgi:hypothetical protein